MRSAYKFYDVKTDYLSGNYQKPLQAKFRFFGNLKYETFIGENGKQWKFDYKFNGLVNNNCPTRLQMQ